MPLGPSREQARRPRASEEARASEKTRASEEARASASFERREQFRQASKSSHRGARPELPTQRRQTKLQRVSVESLSDRSSSPSSSNSFTSS